MVYNIVYVMYAVLYIVFVVYTNLTVDTRQKKIIIIIITINIRVGISRSFSSRPAVPASRVVTGVP